MKIYRITDVEKVTYAKTIKDAQTEAKKASLRNEVRIDLVEFSTDQASIIALLNGQLEGFVVLQSWGLTPRGGVETWAD